MKKKTMMRCGVCNVDIPNDDWDKHESHKSHKS